MASANKTRNIFQEHGAAWIWPAPLKGDRSAVSSPANRNQYVQFRREIDLSAVPAGAELTIIADSNYAAWINGQFVGTGQFVNYPDRRTWDVLPIPAGVLKKGRNVLAVLARYHGEGFQAYIPGEPGLIYVLRCGEATFVSGPADSWRIDPCFRQGPVARITRQLGFTFEYDARKEDGWRELDYARGEGSLPARVSLLRAEGMAEAHAHPPQTACEHGTHWSAVSSADIAGPSALGEPIARPVERLSMGERTPSVIVANGVFRRDPLPGSAGKTLAWAMERDYLSTRLMEEVFVENQTTPVAIKGDLTVRPVWKEADGVYFVVDLGREEAGMLELELEANAGAVVDISHGEHLNDLRVRSETSGRNFSDRYVCKEGRQLFNLWLDRWAGRYIQLHIHGLSDRLVLHYVGLRPTDYPLEERGAFRTDDELKNRIYEVAVRTMRLCTHERYEDCPWREQALYENDSRNQALCGYYCFGEYRFPQVAFDSLGRGYHDDGFLEMTAPANLSRTIPSFSMVWVVALEDHYLHTGDAAYIATQMPVAEKMLAGWLATRQDGLMPAPKGKRFWHFYDWADGLDGGESTGAGGASPTLDKPRFDAPLNLFLCLALEAAAKLAAACGSAARAGEYASAAEGIRREVHRQFFDPARDAYKTYLGEGTSPHYAELTQALAILAKAAPEDLASRLRERLATGVGRALPADPTQDLGKAGNARPTAEAAHEPETAGNARPTDWVVATLSQSIYKFLAVFGERHRHGPTAFRRINDDWGKMLFQGATSFWEVLQGAEGWAQGASLCHGWSAIPVYFYHAYLLGVQPTAPGFAEFTVDPVTSAAPSAQGRVPTPHGPIDLKWERADDHVIYELKHPKGTKPVFPSAGKNDVMKITRT
jgi:hypothetical protein